VTIDNIDGGGDTNGLQGFFIVETAAVHTYVFNNPVLP
jgi:hypothetical protein